MAVQSASIRKVGRHAIRLNLARVAFDQFCLQGFSQVTFDELATAAGVSRSTFLRHFRTKEDAVLFVFDPVGRIVAAKLYEEAEAEAGATGTASLREAVRAAAGHISQETPELLDVMRLVEATPELREGLLAKQSLWIEDASPAAISTTSGDEVVTEARVAAVFACFTVALRAWGSTVDEPLMTIVDRALTALD